MTLQDTTTTAGKAALASSGVWGSLISIAGPLVLAGLNAAGKDTSGIDAGTITNWLIGLSGVIGGGISLYGRLTATQAISGIVQSKS